MSYVESVAILSYRETQGTDGDTINSGAKRQILLSQIDSDADSIVVGLTSGDVELVDGLYRLRLISGGDFFQNNVLYLEDIDNTSFHQGITRRLEGDDGSSPGHVCWLVDAGGSNGSNYAAHLEVSNTNELGNNSNYAEEVYAFLIVEKLAQTDQGDSEAIVSQYLTSGTTGGGDITSGAIRSAPLDTKVSDPDAIVGTISGGALPLAAGTYFALGHVETTDSSNCQASLENDTDGTTIALGLCGRTGTTSASFHDHRLWVTAVFTLASAKDIALGLRVGVSRTGIGWGWDDNSLVGTDYQASTIYIRKIS